jgi:hypothetical protein
MKYSSVKRKVCAPAAMLLAAAVTTAVSAEAMPASPQPDLSWALNAAVSQNVRATRAFLARKAAYQIRDLDRLSGAAPRHAIEFFSDPAIPSAPLNDELTAAGETHVFSSHQHSAP